jgi:acyl carrier protein
MAIAVSGRGRAGAGPNEARRLEAHRRGRSCRVKDDVVEQVRRIVGETFGIDLARISEDTVADDIDGWDSLAHARLILRMQRIFDMELDPSAANAAQSVGALAALVAHSRNMRR